MNEHSETTRAPASAFLLIDSQDRDQRSGDSADVIAGKSYDWTQPLNQFVIQKRQAFVTGYFHRIAVTECRFEYSIPNVNARNNKVEFACPAGSASVTLTVPEGYYTPVELAAQLETVIQVAFPVTGTRNIQVSYESQQACFRINNTGSASEDFLLLPYEYSNYEQQKRGLYFLMNWGQGFGAETVFEDDQYGLPSPSMCYTKYIDICSRKLTQYQKVKDNSTRDSQNPGVLLRLYISNYTVDGMGDGNTSAELYWPGCRPCVIHRIFNVPKYSTWSPGQYVDGIDIELRDDAGNLLYTPGEEVVGYAYNSSCFQMTLHCSEN